MDKEKANRFRDRVVRDNDKIEDALTHRGGLLANCHPYMTHRRDVAAWNKGESEEKITQLYKAINRKERAAVFFINNLSTLVNKFDGSVLERDAPVLFDNMRSYIDVHTGRALDKAVIRENLSNALQQLYISSHFKADDVESWAKEHAEHYISAIETRIGRPEVRSPT